METKTASLAQLDLFSPPLVQDNVERQYYMDYRPVNQLTDDGPILFDITEQKHFLDLYNCQLYVKLNIVKADNTPIAINKKVIPVNNTLHSLFEKITVTLEGKELSSSNNYPYKAMLSTLLTYGADAKSCQLRAQGFWKDDSDQIDLIDQNVGANFRRDLFQRSNYVELQGPLYEDIFMQKRYLLNNTRLTIRLDRTSADFSLLNLEAAGVYKIHLEEVIFKAHMIQLNPVTQFAISKSLETKPALYCYTQREIRVENVNAGFTSGTLDNLFPNKLPSRVLVTLIPARAYNGDFKLNPFNFKPYDLQRITLSVNNDTINTFTPTFDHKLGNGVAPSYLGLYEAFRELGNDYGNGITLFDFANSCCIYAFNIKPAYGTFCTPDHGHVRLSLSFKKALTEPAVLLIHAETPAIMEITNTRNVTVK